MDHIFQLRLVPSFPDANTAANGKVAASVECLSNKKESKGPLPKIHPTGSEECQSGLMNDFYEKKRKSQKDARVQAALQDGHGLSAPVQKNLLGILLADGWGRMAHGITRQLKCPKRFGLKLVEIALIMTVYDATVAGVNPRLFSPLTIEDFENETSIDRRDISRALSALLVRGALLKQKIGGVSFWGLNPHFFAIKDTRPRHMGKSPMGNSPTGEKPSENGGNLPLFEDGGFHQGEMAATTENNRENSTPKNLNQESLKESHLRNQNFPVDMLSRWTKMESRGFESKVKKEKEIFEILFPVHGNCFFEKCGRVIEFLENKGSTKNGVTQKIHSPMVWIQDHWDLNLARYEDWCGSQKALEEASARKLNQQGAALVAEEEKRRAKEKAEQDEHAFKVKLDSAAERFLLLYRDHELLKSFVQEALQIENNGIVITYYKNYGWNNPIVRFSVPDHFLKVETGERITEVVPSKKRGAK